MITAKQPVTMAQVNEIVKKQEESLPELKEYLKKFTKLTKEKAEKLSEEISALNNIKIKEENIVKLADFVPKTSGEVNKIFTETTLSEEEINAILEITKKY